jgi:Protein of unknown function (DUF732)
MPSSRWLASLTIPLVASAALLTSTAIASADTSDGAYLAQLHSNGFNWPPDHDEALTATGRLICDDLVNGWSYDQIAQNIHATLDQRNVTYGDVKSMVGASHSAYCPWWQCWIGQDCG